MAEFKFGVTGLMFRFHRYSVLGKNPGKLGIYSLEVYEPGNAKVLELYILA